MSARDGLHRGFTLIELLVSISIIAILIAILMPALSGSRKEARKTQCLTRLRELYAVHAQYMNSESAFPDLNNDPGEGAWQYNYLIFDGTDFDNNFGPMVGNVKYIEDLTILYCPVQTDPFHSMATPPNPWPARPPIDTRSGYGRRFGVSGKSLSQLRTIAFLSEVIHLPQVVDSAHRTGVNVAYTDGHAKWVGNPGLFTRNGLSSPFDPLDNPVIQKMWEYMDREQ